MDVAIPACLSEEIRGELRHVTLANPELEGVSGPLREISIPVAACTSLEGKVFQNGMLKYQLRLTGEFADDMRDVVLEEVRAALRLPVDDSPTTSDFDSWASASSINIKASVAPDSLFPDAELREVELVTGEVVSLRVPNKMLDDVECFVENVWWPSLSRSEKQSYAMSGTILERVN